MTTADFMVIAHRGASSYAPENTLAAFDLALHMGCRHVELDVDFTSDGDIVVMHDDTVDRTTNGTGPVGSHARGNCHPRQSFLGQALPALRGRHRRDSEVLTHSGPGSAGSDLEGLDELSVVARDHERFLIKSLAFWWIRALPYPSAVGS